MAIGTNRTIALAAALLAAGCASPQAAPPTTVADVGVLSESIPYPRGYLAAEDLPDSLALLPPPPAEGTAAKAADQEAYARAMEAGEARWALAASDADLGWPHVVQGFEPILGLSLSDGSRPHTEMLLRRAMADAGLSTYRAKTHYNRVRPFVENGSGSCTPGDEAALRGDGSYPSGHTAIGWMLALVLAELMPARDDDLLRRGYDFGHSRVICRVHWQSDTAAGRLIASATFARLQADPVFAAQRERARAELAQARDGE